MPDRDFMGVFDAAQRALAAGDFAGARDGHDRAGDLAAATAEQFAALLGAGRACLGLGAHDEARGRLLAALALCCTQAGVPDTAAATAHHALGQALWGLGRLNEAMRHVRQALALRTAALGEGHRASLSSMALLGLLHHRLGHLQRAGALQRRCLRQRRALFGDGDPDVTASLQALAQVHFAQGRFDQALCLHESALRQVLQRGATGPSSPSQRMHEAAAWNAVGQVLQRLGRQADAARHLAHAQAGFIACVGRRHPQTASVWQNLAALHMPRAPRRSLGLATRAHKVLAASLGTDHLQTAAAAVLLACCLRRCGQSEAAMAVLAQALAAQARALPGRHPELQRTRQLAADWASQSRPATAPPRKG